MRRAKAAKNWNRCSEVAAKVKISDLVLPRPYRLDAVSSLLGLSRLPRLHFRDKT